MRSKVRVSTSSLEKLIELVREHRILYDASCPDRKDAPSIWENISKSMTIKGTDGTFWKKRWRNLRDMYVKKRKIVRREREGHNVKRAMSWHFYSFMSFLDDYIVMEEYSIGDSGMSPESEAESTGDTPYDFEMLYDEDGDNAYNTPKSGVASLSELRMEPNFVSPTEKRLKIKHENSWEGSDMDHVLAELIQEHKARREMASQYGMHALPPRSTEDAFFESCALRMRSLPQMMQSCLMLQIQQLFYNAENPTLPSVSITPLPNHTLPSVTNTPLLNPAQPSVSNTPVLNTNNTENHVTGES